MILQVSPNWGFNKTFLAVVTGDGHHITTLEPFMYTDKRGVQHHICAGVPSDGASTPQVMWNILPPFGDYWLPSIFHDWMYRFSGYPKDKCDSLYLEAMEWCRVNEAKAHTIYEGVHLGGWIAFIEDRKM